MFARCAHFSHNFLCFYLSSICCTLFSCILPLFLYFLVLLVLLFRGIACCNGPRCRFLVHGLGLGLLAGWRPLAWPNPRQASADHTPLAPYFLAFDCYFGSFCCPQPTLADLFWKIYNPDKLRWGRFVVVACIAAFHPPPPRSLFLKVRAMRTSCRVTCAYLRCRPTAATDRNQPSSPLVYLVAGV